MSNADHRDNRAVRSASPAKRTADDMEGQQKKVPGSFTEQDERGPTPFDVAMGSMTPASQSMDTQTQETAGSAMSVDTQATSVPEDGEAQSSSAQDPKKLTDADKEPWYTMEQYDEQVAKVHQICAKQLDEGDRGVVISTKWLQRVMARTSDGVNNNEYPKEARESKVGPLDNSDIVADGAFQEPYLLDAFGYPFIPLKPGLTVGNEIEVLPYDAWAYIIGSYGKVEPKPIIRYAHDTSPAEATQANIIYELYPPVITVRKVPQPGSTEESAPKKANHFKSAVDALRAKKEQETRGQNTPDDAARLVAARTDRFQNFLVRAKEAAGIPRATKVKIWRLPNPTEASVDQPDNKQSGVLSPPASRDSSPAKAAKVSTPKLVVDKATFDKMELGKDLEPVELKDETGNDKYNGSANMEIAGLFQDQTILLEEQIGGPAGGEFQSDKKVANRLFPKKNGGSKPGSAAASGRSSPTPSMTTRGRTRRDGRTRGTTGLSNLGNTCYMNSALQCIRSVEELACYFLSKKYKPEINNDNPLGHHGSMANAYAGVLEGIYGNNAGSSFSPNQFKRTLGGVAPLFSGYGQQDSQEFLSFLVDALHEDLNRIYKKPYIENPDSDDAKVKDPEYITELGRIYQENHHKRNDSIAMDLFSGFYKNTMECPDCDKVSVTFDPYSLLTVQLPMDHAFQHIVTFVPLHGKPVMHQIDIDKNSSIKTLKEHVAKKYAGLDANRLWMVEVYNSKIYKAFDDNSILAESSIQNNDYLFMFELEASPNNAPVNKKVYGSYGQWTKQDEVPLEGMDSSKADVFAVPIVNRQKSEKNENKFDPVLHPVYITLTREEAKDYEVILKKALMAVQNITSRDFLKEFEETSTGKVEEVNGDAAKEQTASEDVAGVSDHSTQSEDGYVNVSLDKPTTTTAGTEANGTSQMDVDQPASRVPDGFMDPQYFLSPALRNQLFDVRYAESAEGLHCTGMGCFRDNTVKPMFDRVTLPARRSSLDSASDESTTSAGSGEQGNSADESDADDLDQPDIRLGGEESTLSAPTVDNSDDEAPQSEPNQSRGGRQKGKKRRNKKGKKQRQKTYGKRDQMRYGQKQNQNRGGYGSLSKANQQDDSPYYIQLGECIILDWRSEALDSLFGDDHRKPDPNEMRGHMFTSDTGREGELFYDEELEARRTKRDERKKNGIDLEDCFAETGKREVLSANNEWYCNRCKDLKRATKTLDIWTLPDILVVHLKRFGGTRSFRDKIDVMVEYPIEGLDMTDKVGVKQEGVDYIYDLFAVDNHFGGLGGGHYTAMAKNFNDGEWYDYNDAMVSKIGNGRSLQSAAAYLLFYRRRSAKPLGPQYLQELVEEYRNPESAYEEYTADESGEGKLGGPARSSQHGSSSALAGAGVGVMSSQKGNGANGGIGPDRLLTQGSTTNNYEYGAQGNDTWGFDGADDHAGQANELLNNMNEDDASSTKAEFQDREDSTFGDDDAMDYSTDHSNQNNSPTGQIMDWDNDDNTIGAAYGPEPPPSFHIDSTDSTTLMNDDEAVAEIHVEDKGVEPDTNANDGDKGKVD